LNFIVSSFLFIRWLEISDTVHLLLFHFHKVKELEILYIISALYSLALFYARIELGLCWS